MSQLAASSWLPVELIEAYIYSLDRAEKLYAVRHLDGCRIIESREVEVVCRIVWNHASALFHPGFIGVSPDGREG